MEGTLQALFEFQSQVAALRVDRGEGIAGYKTGCGSLLREPSAWL